MSSVQFELRDAVDAAMQRRSACSAVREIYGRLQTQIDHRRPLCVSSGKCCNFQIYGHRLFVTTLELAAFAVDLKTHPVTRASGPCEELTKSNDLKLRQLPARAGGPCHDGGCPLQVGRLCGVHAIRPFGCRIFFCDPTADQWQKEQYELFHAELKQLHVRFEIPYMYVEWRTALASLGVGRKESLPQINTD